MTAQGPLAVTEAETTVIVPQGFTVLGRADGVLDIRRTA
jgi:N-methylhydantoinase A